jgi:hypothetical protein
MQTFSPILILVVPILLVLMTALGGIALYTPKDLMLKESAGNRFATLIRHLLGVYTRGA